MAGNLDASAASEPHGESQHMHECISEHTKGAEHTREVERCRQAMTSRVDGRIRLTNNDLWKSVRIFQERFITSGAHRGKASPSLQEAHLARDPLSDGNLVPCRHRPRESVKRRRPCGVRCRCCRPLQS